MTGSFELASPSPSGESCAPKSRKKPRLTANFVDIAGQRFGRLTVASYGGRDRHGCSIWVCLCDCGGEARTGTTKLRSGHTTSCGCAQRERAVAANLKHGLMSKGRRHHLIDAYGHIIDRCYNPRAEAYAAYGGRGIQVCERWRIGEGGKTGLECFIIDLGNRPNGMTIDRVDNDGHYEPGNIRWATATQQARNRRSNVLLPLGDEMVSVAEFSERTGLNYGTVISRHRKGWPAHMLAMPLLRQRRV